MSKNKEKYIVSGYITTLNDDEKRSLAELIEFDNDLLPIEFKLVHADVNKNKDQFLSTELLVSQSTPKLKPIDILHTDRIIGVMYDSTYVSAEVADAEDSQVDETDYLQVKGVIYKNKFPEIANEIVQRASKNELFFSMEVWFTEAQCSTCDQVFANSKNYCDHLNNRFEENSSTSRILRGLTFGGAGIVGNPADVNATLVSIGKKKETMKEFSMIKNKEGQLVFDNQAELDSYVADKAAAAETVSKQKDEIAELQDKIESLEASAKSSEELESKLTEATETIENLTKELEELKASKETVEAEFNTFKLNLEKDKVAKNRINELTEGGIVFPSDEEKYKKILTSLKEMDEEGYANYRDMLLESIKSKETLVANESVVANTENVPNENTNEKHKFPALHKILEKSMGVN